MSRSHDLTAATHQRTAAARSARASVARSLAVLEVIATCDGPATLSRLAAALAMPKSSTLRLLQGLVATGFVVRDGPQRSYRAGPGALRLALVLVRHGGQSDRRREILERVVDTIGETCNLTTLAGDAVLYLDRVETRWPLRLQLEPGSRVPVHCTASGKLLLALSPLHVRNRILDATVLTPHTARTLVSREALDRELARIRRRGFATDGEEFIAGLVAVAVPVRDDRGAAIAAIACHAPMGRLDLRSAIRHVPLLEAAARDLAVSFGAAGSSQGAATGSSG